MERGMVVPGRTFAWIAAVLLWPSMPVAAQPRGAAPPTMTESCPGLVAEGAPWRDVRPAAFKPATGAADEVRLTFIGHATFLIESPHGVKIATDYNDYVRPRVVPDIVTMNHAHGTHYTDYPDPAIKQVLRGWGPNPDAPARHDVQFDDVRVRNVPTNIRDWSGGTERHGNSIFVFEIANLCIAHLGHLHHTLTQEQLNEIGRVDVVLVPVDGSYTLDLAGMIEVLQSLKAPLMIPMHYFSRTSLQRFLDRFGETAAKVEFSAAPSVVVSKTALPAEPTMLVLPGR
jgi:L-ascorbate metabolism protein UlaG (beta-lactamase superfamily)